MRVPSLCWDYPLQAGVATHSNILTWRIPWTEEPAGLQSMGWQRVRHGWNNLACVRYLFFSFWLTSHCITGCRFIHLKYNLSFSHKIPYTVSSCCSDLPVGKLAVEGTCISCQGCHNKVPQTRWLNQQKFTFSQFWKVQVCDWDASKAVPVEAFFFGSEMALLSLFSGGLSSMPLCVLILFSYKDTSCIVLGSNLMTSF